MHSMGLQAVVLELSSGDLSSVDVSAIGFDGLLPKLDLFMLAEMYFRVCGATHCSDTFLPGPATFHELLEVFSPTLAARSKSLLGAIDKAVPGIQGLADKLARLCTFVALQASGLPQGAHAAGKPYGVDSVTVRPRPGMVCS
jgi:hypothetical protein